MLFRFLLLWIGCLCLFPFRLQAFSEGTLQVKYFPAKIGCLLTYDAKEVEQIHDCTEQYLNFEILKKLFLSSEKKSHDYLALMIKERARHFLRKKSFDYQSVLYLMVFPVKGRKKWLNLFLEMTQQKNNFVKVAVNRIHGKKSSLCSAFEQAKSPARLLSTKDEREDDVHHLKEICTIKLY